MLARIYSNPILAAAGDITSDGAVTVTSAGGTTTSGDITTTGDALQFASVTTLGGAQDLTITAGTGNVTFTGAVGTTRLGTFQIVNAGNVNVENVNSDSMTFSAQNIQTGTHNATTANFDAAADINAISVTANSANLKAGQAIVNARIVAINVTVQGTDSISLINTTADGFWEEDMH